MTRRIMLVDDDRNILASLSIALTAEGFSVESFSDGENALKALAQHPADLAILDIKMPRMDGIEVLKRIREKSDMPVVFLTSKDEEIDQFHGLRMGADDYITKPFSQRLLVERIRAILRRNDMRQSPAAPMTGKNLLQLDAARHLCHWRGIPIPLTVTEFLLVQSLAEKPGHIKTREQLMSGAFGDALDVDDRAVDSHIKRIRRKFKDVDPDFEAIEAVYGAGYRYKDA